MFKNLPKFNEQNFVHFVTSKTFENYPFFKDDRCCLILLDELNFYREKLGFKILGYAIMPDHFHCLIWRDAEKNPELTIGKIMQGIKTMTAKRIKRYLLYDVPAGRWHDVVPPTQQDRTFKLWQSNFYDFNVYSKEKFQEKLDYIHKNPIVAGMRVNFENYQWSSYRQMMGIDKNPVLKIDYLEL